MEGIGDEVLIAFVLGLVPFLLGFLVYFADSKSDENGQNIARLVRSHNIEELVDRVRRKKKSEFELTSLYEADNNPLLNCKLCEKRLNSACETFPCSHLFCGTCLLEYWKCGGEDSAIICPVDKKVVNMIVPNYVLRSLTKQSTNANVVEAGISRYNSKFTVLPRNRLYEIWFMLNRMYNNFSFLSFVVQVYFIIAVTFVVMYILLPFDLLPESSVGGIFFFLGLLDDLLLVALVGYFLSNLYRASLMRRS